MADWLTLLPFLIAVGAAAVTGARYMPGPWYERLAKPWWTPPNWLFPPAWAVLYAMIAVAGWFAWRAQGIGPLVVGKDEDEIRLALGGIRIAGWQKGRKHQQQENREFFHVHGMQFLMIVICR